MVLQQKVGVHIRFSKRAGWKLAILSSLAQPAFFLPTFGALAAVHKYSIEVIEDDSNTSGRLAPNLRLLVSCSDNLSQRFYSSKHLETPESNDPGNTTQVDCGGKFGLKTFLLKFDNSNKSVSITIFYASNNLFRRQTVQSSFVSHQRPTTTAVSPVQYPYGLYPYGL